MSPLGGVTKLIVMMNPSKTWLKIKSFNRIGRII
jgi:hypothetical protein